MSQPTLILTPRYTEDAQALWRAANQLGWHVERLSSWRIPETYLSLFEPVLYLEALFGPTLAEQMGVTLLNPPEDWLVGLPDRYRKRQITVTSLGVARDRTEPAFIKPPNDKSFVAKVYTGADLPSDLPGEMSVLVSEVVTWESEFRCFVLNRQLHTYSIYARLGELQDELGYQTTTEEQLALEHFMAELLLDMSVPLPEAIVVDVGYIQGRGWACIELNAAWGAGIYGCDPVRALAVIRCASQSRQSCKAVE
ncbi:ATP-grasp domain-containing protein [Chitinimonas viridis]|uniref:ATP-grasp domain-containing protein n=1 Tax=Chitinimonas viridis TaxID=664880 RepID=A0ABT8B1K8_9NEIS|nr:ATP-grasp domain-containing protein [Chitinimonas viridis]MDN3576152.1 ATP-grasp domain-containing protein [Chitinimonas viridis]